MSRRKMNKKNQERKVKKANSKKAKKQESHHVGIKELNEIKDNLNSEINKYIHELGEADCFMHGQTTPEGIIEAIGKMHSASRNLRFQTRLCDLFDPSLGDFMACEIEIAADNFKSHSETLDHGEEKKSLYKKFFHALLERAKSIREEMKDIGIGLGFYEKISKIQKITIKGNEVLPFVLDFCIPSEFKERLRGELKPV